MDVDERESEEESGITETNLAKTVQKGRSQILNMFINNEKKDNQSNTSINNRLYA
jgi:hypothetical protein